MWGGDQRATANRDKGMEYEITTPGSQAMGSGSTDQQSRQKLYTFFRVDRPRAIPCPAAHPCISHIRECPLPGGSCMKLKARASRCDR